MEEFNKKAFKTSIKAKELHDRDLEKRIKLKVFIKLKEIIFRRIPRKSK